ncbi:MAG: DMT family transporter [Peptococcaceae bacterium]|nr:DMT family transporter [Peptococcaceae bacterium]
MRTKEDKIRQHKADLALLGVAFIWGITFVAVKDALADIGPFYFLAFRFAAAFLFLGAMYYKRLVKISRRELGAGVFIGLFLFGGYAFQTMGLKYTGAANAGFITGLSVVLVPLFISVSSRRLPSGSLTAGVLSSATGLALLSLSQTLIFNYGDLLVFFCAVCFAGHIIAVGRFASRLDPVPLTAIQIGTVSAISFLFGIALETPPSTITGPVWKAFLITSIPATSLAFLIQNKAQKFTSAIHTAVIFTTEPVFAGIGAYFLAGEVLSPRQLAGCALILAGMLVADLKGADPRTKEAGIGKQELGIGEAEKRKPRGI